jgi:hypothetical protein
MRTPRAPSKKRTALSQPDADAALAAGESESVELMTAAPTAALASHATSTSGLPATALPSATAAAHLSPPSRASAGTGDVSAHASSSNAAISFHTVVAFLIGVVVGAAMVVALLANGVIALQVRAHIRKTNAAWMKGACMRAFF